MYGNNNGMNNDFNNNMTGSYENPNVNPNQNYNNPNNMNGNYNYNNGNYNNNNYNYGNDQQINFSGFSDETTGANRKLNKWIIIIPCAILLFIILLAIIIISSANKYTVKTKSINIQVDGEQQIEVSASSKVKNKLTYKSDDEKVATVDASGKVKGTGIGNTAIYVGIKGKKSRKVSVIVTTNKTELIFKQDSYTVAKDSTVQLEIKNHLADDKFTWTSNNEDVATVDQTGLVTGVHGGTATITVVESDGRRKNVKVTVTSDEVLIQSITLTDQTIGIGEVYKIKPIPNPQGALEIYKYSSSKESVATVSTDGKVTGIEEGTTTITVTAHNGPSTTAKITVDKRAAASVKIDNCVKSMHIGDTLKLTATVLPAGSNQTLNWKSSNSNVISVSSGSVKAISQGKATITATTQSGKSASCTITVGNMTINSIKLNYSDFQINKGATKSLNVTFNPSSAKNFYTVKWTSSNNKVATVNSDGLVKGVGVGNAKITARAGNKTATATVQVNATSASSLTISNCPTQAVFPNKKITLTANTDYGNATVKWTTSDSDIATVGASGKSVTVQTKKTGTVTIKAESGSAYDRCVIYVNDSIQISGCPKSPVAESKYTLTASTGSGATVAWKSNNTSLATVSNGVVTTKGVGTVKITATSNGQTATCTMNLQKPKITKINTIAAQSVKKGSTITVTYSTNLSPTVLSKYYTTTDLSTKSSTSGIVTITEKSVNSIQIKGAKAGSTTVYIMIGGQSRAFSVKVTS